MNPNQIKNMIATQAATRAGAAGRARRPHPDHEGRDGHPSCRNATSSAAPFDNGVNRPVARLYFILDEDDLNRSNTGNVTEKLQFQIAAR